MTAEEVFCELYKKYVNSFYWYMFPFSDQGFVAELRWEIGSDHFLYHKKIWAVAKCDFNDDVLYVTGNEQNEDVYYIFHLTYSKQNTKGYPKYIKLDGIEKMRDFIQKTYVTDILSNVVGEDMKTVDKLNSEIVQNIVV